MLTRLLIRYLLGYVELSANGGNIEGFLSELFNEGVAAFGIIKRKRVTRLCVLARSYKIVARTAKKHGCRVRISSKRGAVFFFLRLKQKNSLLCGFLAFALTFFLLGQTVFSLEISGDSAVSKGEITSALARYGLSVGVWQRMVDIDYIKQNVMLDIDELAWMTINLSFGRAEVVFHDKTDEINKNEIKNIRIVALRDGQIKRVDVESGLALVSAGDVISKGQTLVEEAPFHIESSWTGGVKAQVLAYTSYTAEFCVDRRYSYRCLTDRKLILKRLRLYNAEIPLGVKKNGFFDYELFEYAVPFELFGVTLPISLVTSEFCEAAAKTTDLNEQSVMVIIDKMQKEYERNNYADKRILSRSGELIETENGYKYVVSYFCEENIGKYEQIE